MEDVSMNLLVELLYTTNTKILEIRAIPIHLKGCQCSLDNVWIFNTRNAHIPLQTLSLCRL